MKPEKLRLGSYVEINGEEQKVYEIIFSGTFIKINGVEHDSVKPIPINKKLLLMFGFIKSPFGYEHKTNSALLRENKKPTYTEFYLNSTFKVIYISDLQNLMLYLYGIEIEKLPNDNLPF